MGILEKVKRFFYDEEIEEDEDEINQDVEELKSSVKTFHKEKNSRIEKNNEDISERELFKAERTFNFPMDIGTEDEEEISKNEVQPSVDEERFAPLHRYNSDIRDNAYAGIRSYASYEQSVKVEKSEEKKFKPTPIISPIYGVVDKDVKKKDIIKEKGEPYVAPKKLDYDDVRKKAYSDIYEEDKEEQKGIFFNLDEDNNKDFDNEEEVKIIYNDVNFEDEESKEVNDEIDDDITDISNKIEEENKVLEFDDSDEADSEDKILSESNEDDLFNLIDNMYNSQDDDEGDEE